MAQQQNKLNVTVVVSGEDTVVTVNAHQKARDLIREALKQSGNQGQPLENWVLRGPGGEIGPNVRIADIGITSEVKLYLNPQRGEGGGR